MAEKDKKYSYDRFDSHGQRVGQAALDLAKNATGRHTIEEILFDMGLENGLRQCIIDEYERTRGHYPDKYFILTLTKHELGQFGIVNVFKNSARSFVLPLDMQEVMNAHRNATKNCYTVDNKHEDIRLLWTLPSYDECISVLKNPQIYDPILVGSVEECFNGMRNIPELAPRAF